MRPLRTSFSGTSDLDFTRLEQTADFEFNSSQFIGHVDSGSHQLTIITQS